MGNLGAHVKSVHHLPFSKKLYHQQVLADEGPGLMLDDETGSMESAVEEPNSAAGQIGSALGQVEPEEQMGRNTREQDDAKVAEVGMMGVGIGHGLPVVDARFPAPDGDPSVPSQRAGEMGRGEQTRVGAGMALIPGNLPGGEALVQPRLARGGPSPEVQMLGLGVGIQPGHSVQDSSGLLQAALELKTEPRQILIQQSHSPVMQQDRTTPVGPQQLEVRTQPPVPAHSPVMIVNHPGGVLAQPPAALTPTSTPQVLAAGPPTLTAPLAIASFPGQPQPNPANLAPLVIHDKKSLIEHYQKSLPYHEQPSGAVVLSANTGNPQDLVVQTQLLARQAPAGTYAVLGSGSPGLVAANVRPLLAPNNGDTAVTSASQMPMVAAATPQVLVAGSPMTASAHGLTRYPDVFTPTAHVHAAQHLVAAAPPAPSPAPAPPPPELNYVAASHLALPLYRPPPAAGTLHGSPL